MFPQPPLEIPLGIPKEVEILEEEVVDTLYQDVNDISCELNDIYEQLDEEY